MKKTTVATIDALLADLVDDQARRPGEYTAMELWAAQPEPRALSPDAMRMRLLRREREDKTWKRRAVSRSLVYWSKVAD